MKMSRSKLLFLAGKLTKNINEAENQRYSKLNGFSVKVDDLKAKVDNFKKNRNGR